MVGGLSARTGQKGRALGVRGGEAFHWSCLDQRRRNFELGTRATSSINHAQNGGSFRVWGAFSLDFCKFLFIEWSDPIGRSDVNDKVIPT